MIPTPQISAGPRDCLLNLSRFSGTLILLCTIEN